MHTYTLFKVRKRGNEVQSAHRGEINNCSTNTPHGDPGYGNLVPLMQSSRAALIALLCAILFEAKCKGVSVTLI